MADMEEAHPVFTAGDMDSSLSPLLGNGETSGPLVVNGANSCSDLTSEPYLLCEHLPLYPQSRPLYRVTVASSYITCEPTTLDKRGSIKGNKHLKNKRSSSKLSVSEDSDSSEARQLTVEKGGLFLLFQDIIGCDCMKGKTSDDRSAYVTIYAYPHKKKMTSKRTVRKRGTLTLTFNAAETYEENMVEANKWKAVIQCLIKRIRLDNIQDFSQLVVPPMRKMLVLINPFGGQGKAVQLFKQRIVPILAEASIPYEMKTTEYAGHAREMMHSLDTSQWYGLLIVSGDGLIYEAVNGLMERPDWQEAIRLPIGVLPGGSGNALCCAISYQAEEPYLDNHVVHASFAIAKHVVVPMDLIAIDTQFGERMYSFLSCCWGLIADIDIESERYRSMGEARFTVGALIRILSLRKYKGKVSFLPVEPYTPPTRTNLSRSRSLADTLPTSDNHGVVCIRSQSMVDTFTSLPPEGSALSRSTSSVEPDASTDLEIIQENGDLENQTREGEGVSHATLDLSSSVSAVPTPLLVPLDQPVPDNWVTVEGEFITVAAIYLSHLNKEALPVPECKLDDGIIYLSITRAGVSKMRLLSIMTAIEKGEYTSSPDSELVKCKAFRIEPEAKDGIMTCDGERISFGSVQGQVLPSAANIMAPKTGYFASR